MPVALSNITQSPLDQRDYSVAVTSIATPTSIDLKPYSNEVENQYSINSCTANAGCSALELLYKLKGFDVDFSRLFLYFYERQLEGVTGDKGAYPRNIGKALLNYGTCLETTWHYDLANTNSQPIALAIEEASKLKIKSYQKVDLSLDAIKEQLANNIPVLLTMSVTPEFSNLFGSWTTHEWNITDPTGLHEVLVIGYDDNCQRLLLENSWGSSWGDRGYFGLPYSYFNSIVSELWTITVDTSNISQIINKKPSIKEIFIKYRQYLILLVLLLGMSGVGLFNYYK